MKIRDTPSWSWSRSGTFGGPTCAPIAHDIYEAILKRKRQTHPPSRSAGAANGQIKMVNELLNERPGKLDRLQLAALAGLMFIGTPFVFSATMANPALASLPWYEQSWVRQIVWYALGIGAGAALCLLDYHTLARWSFVAYWAAIFFLVVVLIPHIGSMRYGARRWIDFGPFPISADRICQTRVHPRRGAFPEPAAG